MDFSVLIPTFNRRRDLLRTLAAYEAQRPATLGFEVVVIDDGSRDGTAEALAAYRSRRFPLRFRSQRNAGPARARNRGLDLARAPRILITGDDIEPKPDLLARHLEAHRRAGEEQVAIVGLTRWPKPSAEEPVTATMRHVDGPGAQQFSYRYFEDGAEYDFRHFYTSNISLRRSLIDREPAGFATAFPAAAFEDAELGHRLAYHGMRILYCQSAVAEHHHVYTASAFYRRQVRCGEMGALLFTRNPELGRWLPYGRLQNLRVDLLRASGERRAAHADLMERLDETTERALRLAERLDTMGAPGLDPLLSALFELGFVRGFGHGLFGDRASRRLAAATLASKVGPAARLVGEALEQVRWPRALSDLAVLESMPER
ncbi:MAG: glycosyltransferase [Acidobacteriota bacterium]